MLFSTRSSLRLLAARSSRVISRANYTSTAPRLNQPSDNPIPANNPDPQPVVPSISETNTVPTVAVGQDAPLQETIEEAIKAVEMQAPNRATTWARSQQPRAVAMTGPRFEQTIMHLQVRFSE